MREGQRLDASAKGLNIRFDRLSVLSGDVDQRFDDRKDVLDAVIELLVEHALAHVGLLAFLLQKFTVTERDFGKHRSRCFSNLAVFIGPWRRLLAHRLLPDRKALARRQPVAEWAGLVRLVGVARPVQRLHHFLAEEEQIVTGAVRQRHDQHAGSRSGEILGSGQMACEHMRCPNRSFRQLVGKTGQRCNSAGGRHRSDAPAFSFEPDRGAVARHQRSEIRQIVENRVIEIADTRVDPEKPVKRLASACCELQFVRLSQCVQMQREKLAEHLGGDALRHREGARCVMVACDQPP